MIGIVSAWNSKYREMASLTKENHKKYCYKNVYHYLGEEVEGDGVWLKLEQAYKVLPKYQWIVATDNDLVFKKDTSLTPWLNTTADLVFTTDDNGLNSGVLLIRNTAWSKYFLNEVLTKKQAFTSTCPEQTTIAYLLYKEPKEKWQAVPQKPLVAYSWNYTNDLILHCAGIPYADKLKILKEPL